MFYFWLICGLLAGGVFLFFARESQNENAYLENALVIAAFVYVGFALFFGSITWIGIELLGLLAFGIFVWLGKGKSFVWLAVGWALHPTWDVFLHLWGPGQGIVPDWYCIACISFDLLLGGYVLSRNMPQVHVASIRQ